MCTATSETIFTIRERLRFTEVIAVDLQSTKPIFIEIAEFHSYHISHLGQGVVSEIRSHRFHTIMQCLMCRCAIQSTYELLYVHLNLYSYCTDVVAQTRVSRNSAYVNYRVKC